jgi:hypothetical protein
VVILVKMVYSARRIFVNTLRLSHIDVWVSNGFFFVKPLNFDCLSLQIPEVSSRILTNKDVAFVAILVHLATISQLISYLAFINSKISNYELEKCENMYRGLF